MPPRVHRLGRPICREETMPMDFCWLGNCRTNPIREPIRSECRIAEILENRSDHRPGRDSGFGYRICFGFRSSNFGVFVPFASSREIFYPEAMHPKKMKKMREKVL